MPTSKQAGEPPPRWTTAQIEAPLDANRDAEFLRAALGVNKLRDDHPVRRMWGSIDPNDRVALHHLADDLRLAEGVRGVQGVVKRLRTDLDGYDDIRYELRVGAMLQRGGQALTSFGGSRSGPDVEFVSQSGHRCGVGCYRLRSGTEVIRQLREATKTVTRELFPLFHFHPMPGDWLMDVTFPDVPVQAGQDKAASDLLFALWKTAGPGERREAGMAVTKVRLPELRRLPGQRRRLQVRFFFPVRKAEVARANSQVRDKIEKERPWAAVYSQVAMLAVEESDSLLGGALKDSLSERLQSPGHPFAGVLLTSARTIEDAGWIPSATAPDTLRVQLTTLGPNLRTWAHGQHVVTYAPEHALEEWSFFETDSGAGSELVRSLTYGVHHVRIESPAAGADPANDQALQRRVQEALARIGREMSQLAESTGVVGFLPE